MWNFSSWLNISVFVLDILIVMDKHTTWSDFFLSDFIRLCFNFVRNNFVRILQPRDCRYPVELVLEANFLLYNTVLSFRINEFFDYKGWANMKNGSS
jgi:hypothetical protein